MEIKSRRRFLNSLLMASGMLLVKNATGYSYDYNNGIVTWDTIDASQLESLVGQSFSVYGKDTKSFEDEVDTSCEMTLTSIYESNDDPNRPLFLTRKRSVIAQFVSTWGNSCIATDQIVVISHPEIIGEADIFLTSKMDKNENPFLEIVFN